MADIPLSLSDSIAENDSIAKADSKRFSETAHFADGLVKRVGKGLFSESVAFADGLTKKATKGLSETAHFADGLVKRVAKILLETVHALDPSTTHAFTPLPALQKYELPDSVSDIQATVNQCLYALNANGIFVSAPKLVPNANQNPISYIIELLQATVTVMNGLGITVPIPDMGTKTVKIGDSYAINVASSRETGDDQIVFARALANTIFETLRTNGYIT